MEPESTTRNSTNQGLQPDANDDTENLKNDITTNQQTQTSSTTPTPSSNDEPLESAADKEDTSSPAFTRSKRKQRDGDNNSTATNNTSNDTKRNIVETFNTDANSSSFKRPTKQMNIASGCPYFSTQDKLRKPELGFVKDGCIYIDIKVRNQGN